MEDEKILSLLFARDEAAIPALEQAHKAICVSMALQITENHADAEECWSDTCLAVWNSIPPTRPVSLRAYVLRIVRNAALNLVASGQRQKRASVLVELDECVTDGVPDRDAAVLGREINAFLGTLPHVEAVIFMRRYFLSQPVKTIADSFGMRENRVSKILAKLRKKLKKHLTEGGIFL